jgi:hypothetical protein
VKVPIPLIKLSFLLLVALVVVVSVSCSHHSNVIIWPGNATKRKPTDYVLADPVAQIIALRNSQPERDANLAFLRGDNRFIGSRPNFPAFSGVPYDALVLRTEDTSGFKLIAFSDEILTNSEYATLQDDYALRFNRTLYKLLQAGKQH